MRKYLSQAYLKTAPKSKLLNKFIIAYSKTVFSHRPADLARENLLQEQCVESFLVGTQPTRGRNNVKAYPTRINLPTKKEIWKADLSLMEVDKRPFDLLQEIFH